MDTMKRKLQQQEFLIENLNTKLKNAQKRESYSKRKCLNLIDELDNANLLNAELKTRLESFGGIFIP
jgi:hypothetical protein